MRKILILQILLLITLSGFSQSIEIDNNGLFVNSTKITKETSPTIIEKILGKPDKIHLKVNTIWTYDKLGVIVYFDPETDEIMEILLELENKGYPFSPTNTFSGNLTICSINIYRETPLVSLNKIKCLQFEDNPLYRHNATVAYLELYLHSLDNVNYLEEFGIAIEK